MKVLLNLFKKIGSKVVTQEFIPEGIYLFSIAGTPFDVFLRGWKPVIRYCGKQWKVNRNLFMLNKHGMSWEESQKEENAHLFKTRIVNYQY